MDKFLITGPCQIKGKVTIAPSKNAAIPILAATLLFDKPVVISNLPKVRDVDTMISLLRSLGSKIILSKDSRTAKIINKKKNEYCSEIFHSKKNERVFFGFRSINRKTK